LLRNKLASPAKDFYLECIICKGRFKGVLVGCSTPSKTVQSNEKMQRNEKQIWKELKGISLSKCFKLKAIEHLTTLIEHPPLQLLFFSLMLTCALLSSNILPYADH